MQCLYEIAARGKDEGKPAPGMSCDGHVHMLVFGSAGLEITRCLDMARVAMSVLARGTMPQYGKREL